MVCYKRYSEAFFFSVLLFLLNVNFTWMLNGMRQFLCVSVLMLAFPWLVKGKGFKYLLLVCLLGYIHATVLLMIPIYFIVRKKPWSRLVLLSIVATVIVIVFIEPFAQIMEDSLAATSESYGNSTVFNEDDDGVHPLRVVIAVVPVILAWINRRRIAAENNPVLNIGINMCLMTVLLYSVGCVTSGILIGRLPIYCEVYIPILLPMLINRIQAKGTRVILSVGCIGFYGIFYFLMMDGIYYISDLTGFMK